MAQFRIMIMSFLMAGLVAHCVTPEKKAPPLSQAEIIKLVPSYVTDREGWAQDIATVILATELEPTAERVCAVIAVIEQESNFKVDPNVANLPKIVRDGLKQKLHSLGPLAGPALAVLLSGKAPGTNVTFESRLAKLRTEKDLDRFFREMADAYSDKFPGSFIIASALFKIFGKRGLRDLNPVTTAGSMQVKVDFAKSLPDFRDLSDGEARDRLYTREGGVRAGTARLLGYKASYNDVIYRFADYNAGVYASRNAAFQKLLADLTGQPLLLDGDLLAYDDRGRPAKGESKSLKATTSFAKTKDMWMWRVRRAVREEKEEDFEETDIWKEVREAWQEKFGKEPEYARMPNVALSSPKLSGNRTTRWFAQNVDRRYKACRK